MMVRVILSSEQLHIDEFFNYLQYEKQYTNDTLINYKIDLKQDTEYLKHNKLTIETVLKNNLQQFLMNLHKLGLSPTSLARKASTLRSFYSYLLKTSQVSIMPMSGIKTPKLSKKLPNILSIIDIDML